MVMKILLIVLALPGSPVVLLIVLYRRMAQDGGREASPFKVGRCYQVSETLRSCESEIEEGDVVWFRDAVAKPRDGSRTFIVDGGTWVVFP